MTIETANNSVCTKIFGDGKMKQNIARSTLVYSGALVLLGLVGYLATGMQSITALIPAFFGIVVFALKASVLERFRPSTMLWTLVALAVVGILATFGGIPKTFGLLMGNDTARPAAVISQSIMALSSLVYSLVLVMIVRKNKQTLTPVTNH